MPQAAHYMETNSQDPFYNLAFEEYILRNRRDGDYVLLWQNANTIVIGKNQNADAEINHAFVEEHGIQVARRMTGGGAVYHDLGNLNYSFITDHDESGRQGMERFTQPVVDALKKLGLDAEASGRNDILVSGRKVSGTAQCVTGGRILHHGTLLFDSDPSMVSGALNVDPLKLKMKGTASVRSRIGNIRDFLGTDMDMDIRAFWEYLKGEFAGYEFISGSLGKEELEEVDELYRSKYSTWEWNFGRSPGFDTINKNRYEAGGIEACLNVRRGVIKNIRFRGDFLAVKDLAELEDALTGCAYRRDAVARILDGFQLHDFFGGITREQVLNTVFVTA